MPSKENHLEITKTVRFHTLGNLNEQTKNVWLVLHGYAQLPQFFIRKFECINKPNNFIIAPEGIHRLYVKGSSGRVGASWMTKEDRANDIKDYINYLNQLLDQYNLDGKKLNLLGFSQGGATASRFAALGNYKIDNFILWACVFPPDIQFENSEKFKNSKNFFVVGNEDEFLNEDAIKKQVEQMKSLNLEPNLIEFKGNHNIHTETLVKLEEEINH